MDLEFINNKLDIKYYKSIKQYLEKNNCEYEWLNNHINNILTNLSDEKLSDTMTEKKKDSIINTPEIESHKQIFSDEELYKKPWTKLNPIHKILKIKEFVNNLKIDSEKDRVELRDELVILIKTKILTKKEKVKYDEVNGKIISLPNLEYKNNKYFHLQS